MPTFENQKEESLTMEARRPTTGPINWNPAKGCGGVL